MPGTIYVQEAVNLFCGDHDPTKSKHLTLSEHKLPVLEYELQKHVAGGAPVEINVPMHVKALTSTFKLAGHDPDLLVQFGLSSPLSRAFTSYGVIRDRRTGAAIESKAVLEGRLIKVEPDAFKRGDLMSHDYSIDAIMHYELYFDEKEKLYWDFFASEFRIDGVDQWSDQRRILRVAAG